MADSIFQDTIYALSSGRLPAAIGVVRISGRHARQALQRLTGSVPEPRQARYAIVRNAAGEELDRALKLFFAGPNSETGEDIAELHLHGGKAVVTAVLSELAAMDGLRHAEAGEFTRRALLNGKIDLLGVEALGDLVSAETEAQRRFAQSNSGARQAELYSGWRERLVRDRALLEAELDFADEADVPGSVARQCWADVEQLVAAIGSHVEGYRRAEMIRDGYQVVIVGPPNAGKSSLLNALAKRDVAIVSDEAGTTRDLVEVALDLDGMKVVVTDTAGIREGAGKVESIGIERARARAAAADLVVAVRACDQQGDIGELGNIAVLEVTTKADLGVGDAGALAVSVVTGEGIDRLLAEIAGRAVRASTTTGDVAPSRLRHVDLLWGVQRHLTLALNGTEAELRAEELRAASDLLGRLTGVIDVEDLLDVVFSQFCIGK
ncbi:MAG: tRNA uridine-5-carboxymethylaminomethyl(34) synthesis GTPase MnmE [Sphingobium sp.]